MRKLDPSTYEHPLDKMALGALKKVPMLDKIGAWVINFMQKTDYMVDRRGNDIEVNEKLAPRVYRLKKLAEERLCMERDIPMYITMEWDYNAFACGVDNPIIVLNSSIVEDFTDDELLSIIGHEMGHIKSNHMLYHWMSNNVAQWMFNCGLIGGTTLMGIVVALKEWQRKSELTADRAGYIACNNLDAVLSAELKLKGKTNPALAPNDCNFSIEEILSQLDDYEKVKMDSLYTKFIYAYITCNMTHPWSVERMKEIMDWDKSVAYDEL